MTESNADSGFTMVMIEKHVSRTVNATRLEDIGHNLFKKRGGAMERGSLLLALMMIQIGLKQLMKDMRKSFQHLDVRSSLEDIGYKDMCFLILEKSIGDIIQNLVFLASGRVKIL